MKTSADPKEAEKAVAGQLYQYRWNRMGRKGELCLVVARGKMNTCWIRFTRDGFEAITSRNALRRA